MAERLDTVKYIRTHIQNVQLWMARFCKVLNDRAEAHDRSKLEEPEFELWKKMDEEPFYPYGTPEYEDKMRRFKPLFDLHWSNIKNRHHPEHFQGFYSEMTLFDVIEMLCDWFSYKTNITFEEAENLVKKQCERYGFSNEMRNLIFETVKAFFLDKEWRAPSNVEDLKYEDVPHIDLLI